MELVTKDNLDFTRPVKLTKSGITVHKENSLDTNGIYLLATPEENEYVYGSFPGWWLLVDIDTKKSTQHGIRIGNSGYYDVYYAKPLFDIEETINNLNKLETKLKTK